MDGNRSFDEYRMPDELWDRMKPLLPKYDVSPAGGRPRQDLRRIADAIVYRMRTGCQWKAIPPSLAPGSTAHQYFQQWVDDGVFDNLWQIALTEYDELIGPGLDVAECRWSNDQGAARRRSDGEESDRSRQAGDEEIVDD